jgi:hypothetical protein
MADNRRVLAYLLKKKMVLILAGLVIAAAGFWYFEISQKAVSQKQKTAAVAPLQIKEIEIKEITKDWIYNADKKEEISTETPVFEPQKPVSLTDEISQEFFARYLALKAKKGGKIEDEDKLAVFASMMEVLADSVNKKSGDDYSETNIKIFSDANEETIKKYGNNLALLIKKFFDPIPESELTVFGEAVAEDESALKKLEPIAAAYRNAAKEMLSLPAPDNFSESHLKLANSFNNIAKGLEGMQKFPDDPFAVFVGLGQYGENAASSRSILKGLNQYFADNSVVFANNEPANFFQIYLE